MALRILSATKYAAKKLKATVQNTGRLGFTESTKEEMNISENTYIYIAQGESSEDLYMIVSDKKDENAFRVHKSGSYYYIPTKQLFDDLKYDYKKITYIFDLIREESLDEGLGKTYKMHKREIKKKVENK